MLEILSTYWLQILISISAFSIGVISPGPAIMAVMSCSIENGKKPGIYMALGIATGSLFWGVLTASGLSSLLEIYSNALYIIKVLGGCFLLWFAFKAYKSMKKKSAIKLSSEELLAVKKNKVFYLQGLMIHLTNPKAILTYTAVVSLSLSHNSPSSLAFIVIACCFIISIIAHCLYAVIFSSKSVVNVYQRFQVFINGTLCFFFSVAGLKLIFSKQ